MDNEFEINEIFSFQIPGYGNGFFIGKLIPQKVKTGSKAYSGKTNIDDKGSYCLTIGDSRTIIESNSMFLTAYTLNYMMNDIKETRMMKVSDSPVAGFN
jgi:hypothetical protein